MIPINTTIEGTVQLGLPYATAEGFRTAGDTIRARMRERVRRDDPVCKATIAETVGYMREMAELPSSDPDVLLDVVHALAETAATAAVSFDGAAQHAYEMAEVGREIGRSPEVTSNLARALLLGPPPSADLRYQVSTYGIDMEREYVAFCARPCPGYGIDELTEELRVGSGEPAEGLIAQVDGDLVGFLTAPPAVTHCGVVGVGPRRTPDRLAESFQLARRAADVARAFGLSGVRTFDTLGLLPTILADADMGEQLERLYVRPVADIESQPDMLTTIRTYFACDMNVDRAAKALFLHPNTLRYRLGRFEELTGAKLRDPANAMKVWWALQHASLTGGSAA